jgi:hypothetical protein
VLAVLAAVAAVPAAESVVVSEEIVPASEAAESKVAFAARVEAVAFESEDEFV